MDVELLCERLRGLLAKATPGPWFRATSFSGICSQHPTPGPVQVCRIPENFDWQDRWLANADLIVAMHESLPTLLDTIAAQAAELEGVRKDAERLREWKAAFDRASGRAIADSGAGGGE